MTLILSGTNGLSDVDGTAATPAIRGTDANTGIFFPAADTIAFSEGGVEAMRLDSSGNLGLGVTPSAWGAAWKANQYVGGSIASPNGNNNLILQNAYNDGTNYRYIITGAASYYQQSAGQHIWLNAPSGTAGNAISFTQAMTLDASGNLLVGATSGSKRLTISGSQVDVEYRDTTSGTTWNVGPVGSGSPAGRFNWYTATGAADRMFLTTAGALFNSTGTYGTISDVSLKENIVDATPKLADVMRIRVRNYNMKADPEKQKVIGVIAQELEQVFPGLVEEVGNRVALEDGSFEETIVKAVKYSVLTTILVKAIQELKAEFDEYKRTHP